jgi:hypothetical protein
MMPFTTVQGRYRCTRRVESGFDAPIRRDGRKIVETPARDAGQGDYARLRPELELVDHTRYPGAFTPYHLRDSLWAVRILRHSQTNIIEGNE